MIYILLATYNGEKYLREQLDSLFNQTYQEWILWIHDDNSTDSTELIINEYVDRYPDKIIYLNDGVRCGGAKENFSYLLEKIDDNYDYVMFCDQDDVWINDKIKKTLFKMYELELISTRIVPLGVFSDLSVVNENLNVISRSMWSQQKLNPVFCKNVFRLSTCNVITGCTFMVNKNAVNIYTLTETALMHDWLFGILILKSGGSICFINEPLVLYRQHNSNVCGAEHVNIGTLLNKIRRINKLIESHFKNYKMAKDVGVYKNIIMFFFSKIKTIYIRYFT